MGNTDASPDPVVVSLDDVVAEMGMQTDESTAYLDRRTGELITITEEEVRLAEAEERGEEWDSLPDWQAEMLPKVGEVLQSDDFLPLPSHFEIHEWRIMERFCLQVEDDAMREALLDAIHRRGAFRRFKDAVHQHGIADAWYRYRDRALEEIAVDWLEVHDIRYGRRRAASGETAGPPSASRTPTSAS